MIEILPRSHDNVLAVKITGKLTSADYEHVLIPRLDAMLARHGSLSILAVFDDTFTGWSLDAAWDDARYGLKHRGDFNRLAVVGGPQWIRWCMAATGFIFRGEMHAFPDGGLEEAWSWVETGKQHAAA